MNHSFQPKHMSSPRQKSDINMRHTARSQSENFRSPKIALFQDRNDMMKQNSSQRKYHEVKRSSFK